MLQDHVHQMGNCLLQMDGNEEPSVHLTLQRLTTEAMTLIAQLARLHGKVSGPVVYNAEPSGTDQHLYPPADEAFHARILVGCPPLADSIHKPKHACSIAFVIIAHQIWGVDSVRMWNVDLHLSSHHLPETQDE